MSYSTSISSSASRAAYRSSATTNATSWRGNRTLSVASTAWTSFESVGIHARPCSASMAPVTTSLTFGCASAAEVSMRHDPGVRDRRAQDGEVEHPGQLHVVAELPHATRMNRGSSLRSSEP